MTVSPETASFFLLSFEGPDRYATAGGLGVRITHLADTLADKGFETHLLFVGDPDAPGREVLREGRLTYHRWCQWISRYYPLGVYHGEEDKLHDFNASVPPFVAEFVRTSLAAGKIPVILAEEWHTAEALVALGERLRSYGLDDRTLIFWNANNTMSFHRVDWARLAAAAQITTVSRYMKHLMWQVGVNPIVIPNGIPENLLEPVPEHQVESLRRALDLNEEAVMLFKVGRFDPAKRWLMAVEAAACIKRRGLPVVFPMVGGIEPHGAEVFGRASELGLTISDIVGEPNTFEEVLRLIEAAPRADLYNLRFFMSQEMLRPFYRASDAVLANSGHEPFGLVGLEAMGAGGLVYTGATGEDYTSVGRCAVALDTDSPQEIVTNVLAMKASPTRMHNMRHAGKLQAAEFTWPSVAEVLIDKVAFTAHRLGVIGTSERSEAQRVREVVIYVAVHQPRQLRVPTRAVPAGSSIDAMEKAIFDHEKGEERFRETASRCFYPAVERFRSLLDRGFKVAIGCSLSFVEQARRWDPALLDVLRKLVRHPNVELVNAEPAFTVAALWDIRLFMERVKYAGARLQEVLGVRPLIVDTSGLMMSDAIYHALDAAGFRAAFADGGHWLTNWREPTQVYHHEGGRMKILTRHNPLSEDVALRFSDRSWFEWPLMADRYASWIAANRGKIVVLSWDMNAFGMRHGEDSGIFRFLDAIPDEVRRAGLEFATPSEAVARYGSSSFDLPNTEFASSRAGSVGLGQILGNGAEGIVLQLMTQAHQKAVLTGRPELIEFALRLSQSDNAFTQSGLHTAVGVTEIQQVYRSFIRAVDDHLERAARRPMPVPETNKTLGRRGRKTKITKVAPQPLALSS